MGCCLSSEKDPSLRPDPRRPRECTDSVALGVFFLFWCGMIMIAVLAILQGDLLRLVYGVDSFGNTCGKLNRPFVSIENGAISLPLSGMDMRNKTYIFPMDIFHPFDTAWICVKKCPSTAIIDAKKITELALTKGIHLCSYDVDVENYTSTTQQIQSNIGPCPVLPVFRSTAIINRCIPTDIIELGTDVFSHIFGFLNTEDVVKQSLNDVINARQDILWMCLFAFVISILLIFVIRFIASIVVYLIFGLVLIACVGMSLALWYCWWTLRLDPTEDVGISQMLVVEAKNEDALLMCAIVVSIISTLMLTVICCLWQSASLVVDLFKVASRAVQAMPMLLVQPFFTFLVLMLFLVYWSGVALLLFTSGSLTLCSVCTMLDMGITASVAVFNRTSSILHYVRWYHAIGLVWTVEFLFACQQMIIAGSVAAWYFSRDRSRIRFPICTAFRQLVLYHLGTVALGSLIIAVVKIPRFVLILTTVNNRAAKYLLSCLICFLYCLEKCLRYLHHNAYTIVAIEGRSFFPAAVQALGILSNNAVHVAAINTVGAFVLFLGKCGVAALTGLVASLRFRVGGLTFRFAEFIVQADPHLHYWAIPLLIVCVIAYFIAHCFLSIYEMVIDTLFLCFVEDRDFADRTGHLEYTDSHFKNYMADTIRRERRLCPATVQGHTSL